MYHLSEDDTTAITEAVDEQSLFHDLSVEQTDDTMSK